MGFIVDSIEDDAVGTTVTLRNGELKVSVLYRTGIVPHVVDLRGEYETWYNMYHDTYNMIDDELLEIIKIANVAHSQYTLTH
mgnify:CR=1 FL=1